MAVLFRHAPLPSLSSLSSSSSPPPPSLSLLSCFSPPSARPKHKIVASSSPASSSAMDNTPTKFMDFPFVTDQQRNLMVDLVSTVENRLQSQLKTCSLPPDAQYFHNQNGTAHGSLHIRSAHSSSPVDFILGSWLHSVLPTGGALNITSLSTYLNTSTDAPNFFIELIQSSPTSLILILDLPPRKDLVLHPDYLQTFYEDTMLDSLRQKLDKLPEVQPYYSSSLYIRCFTSPTSIMIRVNTEGTGPERMEEILKDHVHPVAKEALEIWLDQCACGQRIVDEAEKAYLERRDELTRNKSIDIDLGSSLPRLFGPDTGNRILQVIREVFNG